MTATTEQTSTITDQVLDEMAAAAARLETLAAGLRADIDRMRRPTADGCADQRFDVCPIHEIGDPGCDRLRDAPLPGTLAVADVPVDGTVKVQVFLTRQWGRVIGERPPVGGQSNRSLVVAVRGTKEVWTFHRDHAVQVRRVGPTRAELASAAALGDVEAARCLDALGEVAG